MIGSKLEKKNNIKPDTSLNDIFATNLDSKTIIPVSKQNSTFKYLQLFNELIPKIECHLAEKVLTRTLLQKKVKRDIAKNKSMQAVLTGMVETTKALHESMIKKCKNDMMQVVTGIHPGGEDPEKKDSSFATLAHLIGSLKEIQVSYRKKIKDNRAQYSAYVKSIYPIWKNLQTINAINIEIKTVLNTLQDCRSEQHKFAEQYYLEVRTKDTRFKK